MICTSDQNPKSKNILLSEHGKEDCWLPPLKSHDDKYNESSFTDEFCNYAEYLPMATTLMYVRYYVRIPEDIGP